MKKKLLFTATVAALALTLASCSGSTAPTGETTSNAPGPEALENADGVTKITVWHGLGGVNGEAFQAAVDAFNADNEGEIEVEATYQGRYADLLAKYTAALRTDSAPTVMLAGDIATGYMIDVGRSIPASDMAAANPDDVNFDDLLPLAANYYNVDDVQWAVPMNTSTPMLWVNRDILTQAGISDTSDLTTLDGVVDAAETIQDATGQIGLTMPDDDWYIEQLVATSGELFCSPDNGRSGKAATSININNGEAADAITKVADLYRSGVAVAGAPDGSAATSAFMAGQVGMTFYSSGLLGDLDEANLPFEYEALPFPISGPEDESGVVIGGAALWLSNTAEDAAQVAGWKLVDYLTSADTQETFSQATGYIPINTKTLDSDTEKAYLDSNPNVQAFIDQITTVPEKTQTAGCVTGAMTGIRSAVIDQLQAAYAGSITVDEALDTAVKNAQTAIDQYNEQTAG